MGDPVLSTPQKVLRGSLRAKMTSVQEQRVEEEKREARRIRGRESYARRRQASLFADKDRGGEEEEGEEEDLWMQEAGLQTNQKGGSEIVESTVVADDVGYAAGEEEGEGEGEEEEEARERAPVAMRPKRKSSGHRLMDPTPPKKQKVEEDSSAAVVSKFTEGSMRNRASAVPRMDLIGLEIDPTTGELAGGGSGGRASVDDGAPETQTNGSGLFGLGMLGSAAGALNPFRFANRIRAAWDKQKAEYMAYERRKRVLAERKRRGEEAYEKFVRQYTGDMLRNVEVDGMDIDGVNGPVALSTGPISEENPQTSELPGDAVQSEGEEQEVPAPVGSDTSEIYTELRGREGSDGVRARGHTRYGSTFSDRSAASSSASKGGDRGNITNTSSGHLRGLSRSSMRMLSPPPALTDGLNEVKTLVKKKSKIFVSTLTGKDDSVPKHGPTKREIKKQERLRNRVSNLEEQLEKAKKELESITKATNCPPVPESPQPAQVRSPTAKHELRPTNGTADYHLEDTDEGDDTEVDEFSQSFTTVPLSPVVNSSFGGSFNATALAGMNIVGSFSEDQARPPVVGKRTSSRRAGLRALPKRASTSLLSGVTKAKGSRNSPPPPTSGVEVVPPVPRLSRRSSGL